MTRSATAVAAAVIFAGILAGCADDPAGSVAPQRPSERALSPSQNGFYYYQGSEIPLVVDGAGMTLAGEPGAVGRAVSALRSAGVAVKEEKLIEHLAGQGLVEFPASLTPGALDTVLSRVRSRPDITFAAPLYRNSEGAVVRLWNRAIVEFQPSVTASEAESTLESYGTHVLRRPEPDSARYTYWVAYPRGVDPLSFVAALYQDPHVLYAEPDRTSASAGPLSLPPEPYIGLQWHLKNTLALNGVHVDDNVEPVWNTGNKGGGIPSAGGLRIAVIDDGVDVDHPDLLVSTWLAYDVFGRQASGCTDCATSPRGNDTHGTSVAGVAAAKHNGVGVAGIAPDAQLVPIRIYRCTYGPFCTDNHGTSAEVAYAIDWA